MSARPDRSAEHATDHTSDPAGVAIDRRARRKRRGRSLLAGLLVLVPLLAIVGGWTGWYACERGRFEREVAAARERGEPIFFHELKPSTAIPSDENAAPLIVAAGKSYREEPKWFLGPALDEFVRDAVFGLPPSDSLQFEVKIG